MQNSHHAVVWYAQSLEAVEKHQGDVVAGYECVRFSYERLLIDHVRSLQQHAVLRPTTAPIRCLIIETADIAREAQHALLKLLEEPVATTRFHFILTKRSSLLDTVWSRVVLGGDYLNQQSDDDAMQVQGFLLAGAPERLATIAEHAKRSDKEWMRNMLAGVISAVAAQPPEVCPPALRRQLSQLSDFSTRSGSSPKLLLEALALSAPVIPLTD